jgi:hypothetical protein
MLECGNVASIPRVEEGSERYDDKKIFPRGPDNLNFGYCLSRSGTAGEESSADRFSRSWFLCWLLGPY